MSKAVELTVAGQRCRVVTSASEQELKRLASMVEEKLSGIVKLGRPVTTQAMLLAAISLANDVVEERERADNIADKACSNLELLLGRVDEALKLSNAAAAPTKDKSRKARKAKQPKRAAAKEPTTPLAPPLEVPIHGAPVTELPAAVEPIAARADAPAPTTPAVPTEQAEPTLPAAPTVIPTAASTKRQPTPRRFLPKPSPSPAKRAVKPIALHRGSGDDES